MKCHLCGGRMENLRTDLPFKLENHRIIVVKDIPVEQCSSCGEYMICDPVMESLDFLFESMDEAAELEIRRFAA
jgi:YgiT-type zinc finger domain-containing protein